MWVWLEAKIMSRSYDLIIYNMIQINHMTKSRDYDITLTRLKLFKFNNNKKRQVDELVN